MCSSMMAVMEQMAMVEVKEVEQKAAAQATVVAGTMEDHGTRHRHGTCTERNSRADCLGTS